MGSFRVSSVVLLACFLCLWVNVVVAAGTAVTHSSGTEHRARLSALQEQVKRNWSDLNSLVSTVNFLELEKRVETQSIQKRVRASARGRAGKVHLAVRGGKNRGKLASVASLLNAALSPVNGAAHPVATNAAKRGGKRSRRRKGRKGARRAPVVKGSLPLSDLNMISDLNSGLTSWRKDFRNKWKRLNSKLRAFMQEVKSKIKRADLKLARLRKMEEEFTTREQAMRDLLKKIRGDLGEFVVSAQALQQKGALISKDIDSDRDSLKQLASGLSDQTGELKVLRSALDDLVKLDSSLRNRADDIQSRFQDVQAEQDQIPHLEKFLSEHRATFEKDEAKRKENIQKLTTELNTFAEECETLKSSKFAKELTNMFSSSESGVRSKLMKQAAYLNSSIESLKRNMEPKLTAALEETMKNDNSNSLDEIKFATLKKMNVDVAKQMKSYGQVEDQLKFELDTVKSIAAESSKTWWQSFRAGPVKGLNCKCKRADAKVPTANMGEYYDQVDPRGIPAPGGVPFDRKAMGATADMDSYTGGNLDQKPVIETVDPRFLPLDQRSVPEETHDMKNSTAYFGPEAKELTQNRVASVGKPFALPTMEMDEHAVISTNPKAAHASSIDPKSELGAAFSEFENALHTSALQTDEAVTDKAGAHDPLSDVYLKDGSLVCYCTYAGESAGTDS